MLENSDGDAARFVFSGAEQPYDDRKRGIPQAAFAQHFGKRFDTDVRARHLRKIETDQQAAQPRIIKYGA